MKIICYSDIHCEFEHDWRPPKDTQADVMILAGDIVTFRDFTPLNRLLERWNKPVLYVAGNHEYYTDEPMNEGKKFCLKWLKDNHPNVRFLHDEEISIDGVHFFGGTMWTDFDGGHEGKMLAAHRGMSDYARIRLPDWTAFTPFDSVELHKAYVEKLFSWFTKPLEGSRVVISHHAPVERQDSQYRSSSLKAAYNSLDMVKIIEKHQPRLWYHGHTHECDRQTVGKTEIISNQLGYPNRAFGGSRRNDPGFECKGFDDYGRPEEI
jgi:Icc-related predicted phosphoesterase